MEAAKLAFADRDRFYGDPKFSKIPEEVLLSKSYAGERRKLIDPKHASMESRPGEVPDAEPVTMPSGNMASLDVRDTTCVNVVDRARQRLLRDTQRRVAAALMAGDTGIAYGIRLQSLVTIPGHPNELKGGKRPRVTLSPTIILKDGKPIYALSTPGADNQDQALLQVILNLIEFNMTAQQAVEAPRFQTEHSTVPSRCTSLSPAG